MDTLVGDKQPIDSVEPLTNDASNDEIWEIIDKEDDGNNMLRLKITGNLLTLFYRGPEKFVCCGLCIYTIGHWHTTMVANDRSTTPLSSICTDLTIEYHGHSYFYRRICIYQKPICNRTYYQTNLYYIQFK